VHEEKKKEPEKEKIDRSVAKTVDKPAEKTVEKTPHKPTVEPLTYETPSDFAKHTTPAPNPVVPSPIPLMQGFNVQSYAGQIYMPMTLSPTNQLRKQTTIGEPNPHVQNMLKSLKNPPKAQQSPAMNVSALVAGTHMTQSKEFKNGAPVTPPIYTHAGYTYTGGREPIWNAQPSPPKRKQMY
jgi:hypothetical protein